MANWTRSSFSMFSMSERVMITFYDGKIFPVRKRYLCLGVFLNHPWFRAGDVFRAEVITVAIQSLPQIWRRSAAP